MDDYVFDNVALAIREFVLKSGSLPQVEPKEWLILTKPWFDLMNHEIKILRKGKHGEVDKQDG